MADGRLQRVKEKITDHPDFPKPGILFRDIFPVLRHPDRLKDLISLMVEHLKDNYQSVDVIIGLESRGFLFGPLIALELGASFVPVRKKGKLPGELIKVEYSLEYGTDTFEIQKDAVQKGQKVVIVDDLIATGGTMAAAVDLVKKVEGELLECLAVIELKDLEGVEKVPAKCFSLIQY